MNHQQNREKPPVQWSSVMIRLAAVLLCLTMFSCYMMSGLLARYVTRGQGTDSARVAAFDVEVTGPVADVECEVTALEPGKITFTVDNKSEVAIEYSIRVKIKEEAGCGVLVKLEGETEELRFEANQEAEHKYTKVGQLAVGAEKATHTLSFEPLDWTKITQNATGESMVLTQPFTVYIDAVQID